MATPTATDYSTYLHIDELLTLQNPLTEGAHDEMLFIVVHQAYELWFKLVVWELEHAIEHLRKNDPNGAVLPLRRVVMAEELLLQQLRVLETMSPDGFMEFRDPLAPASGFQSQQFRQIESLSQEELWQAFLHAISTNASVDTNNNTSILSCLTELYRDHNQPERRTLHSICELLVDHDEAVARWRYQHALMAAREIGMRQGTGGSLGVSYLQTTLDNRFYPLLWDVRTQL